MDIREDFNSHETIYQEDHSEEESENVENIDDDNNLDEDEILENNNEEENESDDNEIPIKFKYDKKEFDLEQIINFFFDSKLLKKNHRCIYCNQIMNLTKNKKLTDGVQWRCKKNLNIKHDYKLNIRNGSLFYEINTDLRIIYFIIFYNFVNNISINQIFRNCREFTKDLNIKGISRQNISKIHNILRTKIMNE